MKSVLRSATFCVVSLFAAASYLHAATPANIPYGTFGLQFTSQFLNTDKADGIKTTYINNLQPTSATATSGAQFQVEGGSADLSTGGSEVQSVGGVTFKSGSTTIELQRLALESTGTSEARITALVLVNGQFVGRRPIFKVTGGSFSGPLVYGENNAQYIQFKVADEFLKDAQEYFPNAQIQKGTIGYISLNLILTPQA